MTSNLFSYLEELWPLQTISILRKYSKSFTNMLNTIWLQQQRLDKSEPNARNQASSFPDWKADRPTWGG